MISSDNIALKDATKSMVDGSYDEDFASAEDKVGGNRSYNHFYDPLDTTYGKGLSDSPPDRRIVLGTNSFVWASVSNSIGYNYRGEPISAPTPFGFKWTFYPGRNVNTSNIWSWPNARGYEWLGLTATNQLERQTNLLFMFRAVGQVMHLLEDASQPQHVRNEQHWDMFPCWRSPIEDYGSLHVKDLNYQHAMLDWRGDGFSKLEDFWDRHLYDGTSSQPLNDSENSMKSTNTLGLAEWCNGNFIGDRHQYEEYLNPDEEYPLDPPPIGYYPYPSLRKSTDYLSVDRQLSYAVRPSFLKSGAQIDRLYLDKVGAGVHFNNHSVLTYLGAYFAGRGFEVTPTTIKDDNVLKAYHDILIPKAVEYSAGLLDYYFRGTLSATVNGTTVGIRNTSGQDFKGGTFILLKDDASGNRTNVDQFALGAIAPGGILSNGQSGIRTENDLSGANTNTQYILVYQGTIGIDGSANPLDPVDAGIGIGATAFTPASTGNWCGGIRQV